MRVRVGDLRGTRFGRLVVISLAEPKPEGKSFRRCWLCLCDCGTETIVQQNNLRSGKTTSCSCAMTKHGLSKHPLYRVWSMIKHRCYNPNNIGHKYYSERGIEMCDEWMNNVAAFIDYCISIGWKKGLECDRIDTYGNYEPGNIQFLTPSDHTVKTNYLRHYGITNEVNS